MIRKRHEMKNERNKTKKDDLPFCRQRQGRVPRETVLKAVRETAETCRERLCKEKQNAHFFLGKDGEICRFSALSTAAGDQEACGDGKKSILILIESRSAHLTPKQRQSLADLLRRIQEEVLRLYGEPLPFRRTSLRMIGLDEAAEEILEEGAWERRSGKVYRVQTGCYVDWRDAEKSMLRLQQAGIAGYITEVES